MSIAENRWVSVEERMPAMVSEHFFEDDGHYLESDDVLVWDGHKMDVAQLVTDSTGQYWLDRNDGIIEVIAWMPLPTPPTAQ